MSLLSWYLSRPRSCGACFIFHCSSAHPHRCNIFILCRGVRRNVKNVTPHIVLELAPRNSPDQAPILRLPGELLAQIFAHLGKEEVDHILENHHFELPHLRSALTRLALVCKTFSAVANVMLYERCYITSCESLKPFIREMNTSQEVRELVYSFSYFPPLTQLNSENKPEASRPENKALADALALCQAGTIINLKLSPSRLEYFRQDHSLLGFNIVTLHLAHPAIGVGPLELPYTFPNLRTLILQKFIIHDGSQWPSSPTHLDCLRLIDCSFTDSVPRLPQNIQKLKKLELINFQYSGSGLERLLQKSAGTLEYLSLINVGGPDYATRIDNLSNLQSLRALCIGPTAFLTDESRTRFPVSLEQFTIWELLKPKSISGMLPRNLTNYDGLLKFLNYSRYSTPNLRTVRIRGAHCDWDGRKETVEATCRKAHVNLELSMYRCVFLFSFLSLNMALIFYFCSPSVHRHEPCGVKMVISEYQVQDGTYVNMGSICIM